MERRVDATQEFKRCLNDAIENRMPSGASVFSVAPPLGTDDKYIRQWAEKERRIIVSCDRDRELESTITDRVAIRCVHHPVSSADIVDRLAVFGDCC